MYTRSMDYYATRRVAVWLKGRPIPGWTPWEWRWDDEGNPIAFSAYGDRNSPYGWEIDHVVPVAWGGRSALENERPLHWRANVRRGASRMMPSVRKPGIDRLAEILAAAEMARRSQHAALARLLAGPAPLP